MDTSSSMDVIMLCQADLNFVIGAAMEGVKRANSTRYKRLYSRDDERHIRKILRDIPAHHEIWATLGIDEVAR